MMPDLQSLLPEELADFAAAHGEKAFRASQVFRWLHKNNVESVDEMRNLPKKFREVLAKELICSTARIALRRVSRDGTKKYLIEFSDGAMVETVLMQYHHGYSQCISSQVGCRMGCAFCASGRHGLTRNLTAGEMLLEIYAVEKAEQIKISNLVVMGTGEPLDNYDNLVRFLKLLNHPEGRNLGGRSITVSTCGIVPNIYALAEEKFAITLALSLHSPTQEQRKEIMPVSRKYPLSDALEAMGFYANASGRRVTFEYALIKGVNDSEDDAKKLSALIRGIPALVNLIPVNPVTETGFQEPDRTAVLAFQKKLEKYGNNVTIRRSMGQDIDGACGQLREKFLT